MAAFTRGKRPRVVLDKHLIGDPSEVVHRAGHPESGYLGYGPHFNTIQLEFASWLRNGHRARIVQALVEVAQAFRTS